MIGIVSEKEGKKRRFFSRFHAEFLNQMQSKICQNEITVNYGKLLSVIIILCCGFCLMWIPDGFHETPAEEQFRVLELLISFKMFEPPLLNATAQLSRLLLLPTAAAGGE